MHKVIQDDVLGDISLDVIKTPSLALNDAIGGFDSGFVRGRMTQLFGPEGSGKTLLSLLMVKEFQAENPSEECLWIDTDSSFDTKWAKQVGVDLERLRVLRSKSRESLFGVLNGKYAPLSKDYRKLAPGLLDAVISGDLKVGLIVVDNMAQMMGADGRKLLKNSSLDISRTSALLKESGVMMICVNQIREGVSFHSAAKPSTKQVYLGYPYESLLNLSISLGATRAGGNQNSRELVAQILTNRLQPGGVGKMVNIPVNTVTGVVNKEREVLNIGHEYGVIKDYKFNGTVISEADLRTNKSLLEEILDSVKEAANN